MGMPGDPPARQLNPQGPDHEFTMCSPVALRRPPMMLSHALHANHETVAWCTANVLATEQRRGVPTSDDVGSASFLALPLHSPRAAFPDDRDMAPSKLDRRSRVVLHHGQHGTAKRLSPSDC